LSFLPSRP